MAIIAESSEIADDFIDIEAEPKEEILALGLETTNDKFIEAPNSLALCINKAEEEKPTLKDEDFKEKLVELGIEHFGRGAIEGVEVKEKGRFIDLQNEAQEKVDELQQIYVLIH